MERLAAQLLPNIHCCLGLDEGLAPSDMASVSKHPGPCGMLGVCLKDGARLKRPSEPKWHSAETKHRADLRTDRKRSERREKERAEGAGVESSGLLHQLIT